MAYENKIILGVTFFVILLVIALALVNNSNNTFTTVDSFSSATTSSSTAVSKDNIFEGEMSLEKLAEISSCPLTSDKDAFAKCLTEKGFSMYGAEWCPHCQAEKALFGTSFQYIKYVECPDNINLCLSKGVAGYPTWIRENK